MWISFSTFFAVISVIVFSFLFLQRGHYLVLLLMLELVVMILILGIPMVGSYMGLMSSPIILVLLVMGACEASVGLSVMVYLVRFHGGGMMGVLMIGSL